jgi:O-antigen/teichoic acid export membrane protein
MSSEVSNKKIAFNYLSSLWNAFSSYIFLPIYLIALGAEQFGLFAIITILHTAITLLDLGFSATIKRKVALSKELSKQNLDINIYETIYIIIVAGIIISSIMFNDEIINIIRTITDGNVIIKTIHPIISLIVFSMLVNFYNSILWGKDHQVSVSRFNILQSVLKNFGGIIFAYAYQDVYIVITVQAITTLLITILVRRKIHGLGVRFDVNNFRLPKVRNVLLSDIRYTLGALSVSSLAFINYQFDKIVLSSNIDIKLLGYYSLTFFLSQITVSIASPLAHSYFPILARNSDNKKDASLFNKHYTDAFYLSICLLCPIVTTLLIYGSDFLLIWTGKIELVNSVKDIVFYMVIGSFLQALQALPYHSLMARKNSGTVALITLFSTLVYMISCLYLIPKMGLKGAAFSWLIYNVLSFLLTLYVVHIYKKTRLFYSKRVLSTAIINIIVFLTLIFIFKNIDGNVILGMIALVNIAIILFNLKNLSSERWDIIQSKFKMAQL